jgi:hypothetical protein
MTNVFDDVATITIGGKEVQSIEIDGGVIWEKESPTPSTRSVTIKTSSSGILELNDTQQSINPNGVVFNNVPDGSNTVYLLDYLYHQRTHYATISVDADHTTFEISSWTPV